MACVADDLLQEEDQEDVPEAGSDGLRKGAGKAARGAAAEGAGRMEASRISQVGSATRLERSAESAVTF